MRASLLGGMLSSTRSRRVLVVDDDESLRRVTQVQLEDEGYSVMTACDGEEALGTVLGRKLYQKRLAYGETVYRIEAPKPAVSPYLLRDPFRAGFESADELDRHSSLSTD
jgi:CheY-like chemotaxis protein